jgi:predicted DNA-binding WGR domain protein
MRDFWLMIDEEMLIMGWGRLGRRGMFDAVTRYDYSPSWFVNSLDSYIW